MELGYKDNFEHKGKGLPVTPHAGSVRE